MINIPNQIPPMISTLKNMNPPMNPENTLCFNLNPPRSLLASLCQMKVKLNHSVVCDVGIL